MFSVDPVTRDYNHKFHSLPTHAADLEDVGLLREPKFQLIDQGHFQAIHGP